MLAAPRCSFCALAGSAKAPNTSNAALNVSVSFVTKPSLMAEMPEREITQRGSVYTRSVALSLRAVTRAIAPLLNHAIFKSLKLRVLRRIAGAGLGPATIR